MNSCFEHSPSCYSHFFFPTPSSSQCSIPSPFLLRNVLITRRKNRTVMACLRQENLKDRNYCARRGIVFMGFAVIPVSNMRADAIEALITENTELRAQDKKQKEKQPVQESSSQNPFFSLVNALGFLGSGVLAALYALTKKGKDSADATIESMNIKLKEKEAAITSLEKKFKAELLKEKEVCKEALAKANEEHAALLSQLKLANDTITSTGHELQKQKRLAEELTFQIKHLEIELRGARDEITELQEQLKEKLDSLSVLQERIAEKEKELDRLSSVYQQSEDHVIGLKSEIVKLKILVLKNEKELDLTNEVVDKLNAELTFSLAEKNESSKKVDDIIDEYNQFKSSIEEKLASQVGLLGEKEEKNRLLEEQIKCSSDEVKKNEGLISDLSKEKVDLKGMLDIELENAKKLEQELKIMQDALEKSRNEASDLTKELKESRNLCSELGKEVSKAKESLQRNIFEAKQEAEILSGKLKSPKELLNKSNEDLQITSQQLFDAVWKRDILEKELVDAHEKAESAISDLKEEKKITSCLNKELKILETQISKDREFRRSLESDLDEASESLGEMNRNALLLSGELELANSRISSLEDEKDAVFNVLDEKEWASQEARENLEDAHSLVMRLGKERESLEKRGKRLEEELASAKGEILRLRLQINPSKSLDNVGNQETGDGMKKVSRGRKVKPNKKMGP